LLGLLLRPLALAPKLRNASPDGPEIINRAASHHGSLPRSSRMLGASLPPDRRHVGPEHGDPDGQK
jgi:hypothetical protein